MWPFQLTAPPHWEFRFLKKITVVWSNIIFLFCCKTWNYWKKFFLKNSNWVKWKQLLCFSKYYMKVLYWFDYTFCESVDSCIEKHFRWCHLMVTLDTFKNHSSIICLVPATSWFGRNYFSEPARFGWGQHPVGGLLFPLDFLFIWRTLNKCRVYCDFFFPLARKDGNIFPWA